jgi:hypothetical protein
MGAHAAKAIQAICQNGMIVFDIIDLQLLGSFCGRGREAKRTGQHRTGHKEFAELHLGFGKISTSVILIRTDAGTRSRLVAGRYSQKPGANAPRLIKFLAELRTFLAHWDASLRSAFLVGITRSSATMCVVERCVQEGRKRLAFLGFRIISM